MRAFAGSVFLTETLRPPGIGRDTAEKREHGDGKAHPDNIDDAALSAAGYLCYTGKDLATPRGWMNGLRAYNYSEQYARTVRDWATAYAEGRRL